ncbi:MAG: GIY-YIG nuclease family protein [Saprospiraceae bacterium]
MAKENLTEEHFALLDSLGIDTTQKPTRKYSKLEERIIAGFEDIQRWVEEHGREPQHGEERDIFEQLYAIRLERIRANEEYRSILADFDSSGLSAKPAITTEVIAEKLSPAELLEKLGVELETASDDSITKLRHVRSIEERRAAEEIAQREPCHDFELWQPIFEKIQSDIAAGLCSTERFRENAKIDLGDLFILDGQKIVVAEQGATYTNSYGRNEAQLRVVYDNGTQSNLLMRSLQRALNKDKTSRRILENTKLTLFSNSLEEGDSESGTIYVLRSFSEHPVIAEHRTVIHKIGVTNGSVQKRIANAKKDPTYLLADVEIVSEYTLANVNRVKLERLLQRFFSQARLDLTLPDRFGQEVQPREWFLVPLPAIDEAVARIIDGTIGLYIYDRAEARLKKG